MAAALIDGKAFAETLRARVAAAVPAFVDRVGRKPGLATVLVGEDPASQVYVRAKGKAMLAAGMASFEKSLPANVAQADLMRLVDDLNRDENVDGILVQLPLPPHMNAHAVIDALDPAKDVDGFHPQNAGRLAVGEPGLVPCTPLGCLMLLQDRLGDLAGLEAVVIGRSNIVGRPMAQLLVRESCTVTIAHSRTRNLPDVVRRADIVVAAVGRQAMVKGDWLKPGATVIDVGTNRIDDRSAVERIFRGSPEKLAAFDQKGNLLVGDVHPLDVAEVAGAYTPVPGGVGPMTIAVLLRNTLAAAHARAGLPPPEGL